MPPAAQKQAAAVAKSAPAIIANAELTRAAVINAASAAKSANVPTANAKREPASNQRHLLNKGPELFRAFLF
jgi:hypothetical protein